LRSLSDARLTIDRPDHVIAPSIGHIDVMDFRRADELIALGIQAAEREIPGILTLLDEKLSVAGQ